MEKALPRTESPLEAAEKMVNEVFQQEAVPPEGKVSVKPAPAPNASRPKPFTLKLRLTDGEIDVNGKKVSLPVGLGRTLTGSALKALGGIYKGHSLYISGNNGSNVRIKDNDTVRVVPDETRVVSRDERPQRVTSSPQRSRD